MIGSNPACCTCWQVCLKSVCASASTSSAVRSLLMAEQAAVRAASSRSAPPSLRACTAKNTAATTCVSTSRRTQVPPIHVLIHHAASILSAAGSPARTITLSPLCPASVLCCPTSQTGPLFPQCSPAATPRRRASHQTKCSAVQLCAHGQQRQQVAKPGGRQQ